LDDEIDPLTPTVRLKSRSTGKIYHLKVPEGATGEQLKQLVDQELPDESRDEFGPTLHKDGLELSVDELVSPKEHPVVDLILRRYPTYTDHLLQNQSLARRITFKVVFAVIGSLLVAA